MTLLKNSASVFSAVRTGQKRLISTGITKLDIQEEREYWLSKEILAGASSDVKKQSKAGSNKLLSIQSRSMKSNLVQK